MRLNDLIDRQLGPYRIEALIGRGGMAAVYRALDTRLQRHVALKMLYPQYLADTDIVERFRREAITAAQLDHPHIAPIFDVGEDDGIVYLAMKLLPGPSLADVLQREPRLPAERVVTLAQQIALALDEAHQHGIIHRDIKPGNVLFDSRGNAILTDFGIAKSLDAPSLTESSVIVGTPDYIAPEQINPRLAPNGKLDHRADLYSLGALVYRMLTGRRPFDGSAQTVLLAHLQDQPIPPSEVVPQLSAGVDAVIAKVMAKRPEERYDTASEFVQALSESFSDQTEVGVVFPPASIRRDAHTRQTTQALKASIVPAPASATRPTTPPAAEQLSESPSARSRWRSRRMLMIMAIGLLLVVGTGGVLARFMNQSADAAGVALLATTQTAQAASAPPTATPTRTAAPTRTATAKPTATTQPSATTQPTATSTTAPTETTTAPIVVAQATPRPTARPASRPTARPASRPTARPTPQPTPPPAPQPTATPALPRCQAVLTGGFGNLWRTNAEVRAAIGCPIEEELPGYSVEQIFQGGQMYYREAGDQFWIFDGGVSGTWRRRLDVYPSDPEPTDPAPDGLLTPSSGFGRLWQKDPAIRQALGWATTPEVGFTGVIQRFDNGFMLYSPAVNGHGKRIYVLYSNGTFVIYKDTYTGP